MARANLIFLIIAAMLPWIANCIMDFEGKVSVLRGLAGGNELAVACANDFEKLLTNADKESSDGRKMIDAWSHFRADYRHGNSYDFGRFDGCMEALTDMSSKYCTIQYYYEPPLADKVTPVKPDICVMNFGWKHLSTRFGGAICIPDSCSSQDVAVIMARYFEGSGLVKADDYEQDDYCKSARVRNEPDYKLRTFISIVISLITLATLSAVFYNKNTQSTLQEVLQCFSIRENVKHFMIISNIERPIESIDGFKGISVVVVLLVHYMGCVYGFPFKDGRQVTLVIESGLLQVINFAGMITENFFILSGLLVVQSMSRVNEQKSKASMPMLMLQMYMRFFFPLLFLLLVHMLTSPYFFNNTPFYNLSTRECEAHWWSTLLHLQVYLNPGEMCLPHAWYLDVTLHIVLLLPGIFAITKRIPKKYVFVVYLLLTLVTIMTRFIAADRINLSVEVPELYNIKSEFFQQIYFPTHARATSFFAGMVLGELVKNNLIQPLVSKRGLQYFFLFLFTAMMAYNLSFVLSSQTLKLEKYNLTISSSWYTMCLSIIILLSHLYDGPLKRFLSKTFWIYVSKLSLCIYLLGTHMQFLLVSLHKEPSAADNFYVFVKGILIDLALMIVPILFLHFFVEAPFARLGKLMARKSQRNARLKEN